MSEPSGNRSTRAKRRDFVLAWVLYAVFVLALVGASLADVGGAANKGLGRQTPFAAQGPADTRLAP